MPLPDYLPNGRRSPTLSQGNSAPLSSYDNPFQQDFIYNSYAGTDITAVMVVPGEGPIALGELQTISYSTHREKTPVRLVGNTNVSGFVNGPRTIAGSLIFTVFDQYAFYRLENFKAALREGIYPLADMLPPFDVVISMVNEYGRFSKMAILGVSVIDEGQTMSVDDLITEQTYSFMARGLIPLINYTPPDLEALDSDHIVRNEKTLFDGGVMRF